MRLWTVVFLAAWLAGCGEGDAPSAGVGEPDFGAYVARCTVATGKVVVDALDRELSAAERSEIEAGCSCITDVYVTVVTEEAAAAVATFVAGLPDEFSDFETVDAMLYRINPDLQAYIDAFAADEGIDPQLLLRHLRAFAGVERFSERVDGCFSYKAPALSRELGWG